MKYLLDTHILIWWYLGSPELSEAYRQLLETLEKKGEEVGVSIISLWEISLLQARGKIQLSIALDEWFSDLESNRWIHVLPLSGPIVLESTRLGETFHKDPADRLIVSTARCVNLKLLTKDDKIRTSGSVIVV